MEKSQITASEIAMLWTNYSQNSMSLQFLKYFRETVDDKAIRTVIACGIDIAERAIEDIETIFKMEDMPIPDGFSETDVDLTAPKLFTDSFMLAFIENMGVAGMIAWSISQGTSSRNDIRTFFTTFLAETSKLYNLSVDTALANDLYVSPPSITKPDKTEYIEGKKYLTSGLNPLNKRTLNTIEILHLFQNMKTNGLGKMICTGFAQTTTSKEVASYMKRGKDISQKHVTIFSEILTDSDITTPMTRDNGVTDSTTRVFSDKLMLFLISVLSASGQGNYATASTASMRYDIAINYQRLSVEIALFAKSGLEMMLKHNWMEEPPQSADRSALTKK